MHKVQAGHERSVAIVEERSPDLLFMRSTLRISGAQPHDFGRYNCTVRSSLGADSMSIELLPLAPTGECALGAGSPGAPELD